VPDPVRVGFVVNGEQRLVEVEPRALLVQALRDELGLTGAHIGCDTSQCGACTVLVDGKAVKSCTLLAAQADGSEVTTIEGLARDGELHPVQRAFVEHHGLQCGFCTPGMILTTLDLLSREPDPGDEAIRRALRGNLCRCTGYETVVDSVHAAAEAMR
jgi:aerobic carbon-monoxide dehydrogenase small subunit